MTPNRRQFTFGLSALAAVALPGLATAQAAWPAKAITLIAPYPAGGGVDTVARLVGDAKKKAACVAEIDEYFSTSVRRGKVRNGAVYMPPFEGILNQEAMWSIKAYLETRREKPL